jgi:ATP-dependent DNA helicase RecQ
MRREPERVKPARAARTARTAAPAADLSPAAAGTFERLRAWRASVAKEQKLPAYVIFHDATLRAIAAARPGSLAELGTISGVGQAKLAKFGEQVLAALAGAEAGTDDLA